MSGFHPRVVRPEDHHHFLLSFMPGETRRLRPTGIHIFKLTYWADWLAPELANGRGRVSLRYDVRDISRIFARSAGGRWEPVYLKKPSGSFSLRAHKAALAELRAAGKATVDEDEIHAIRGEQQAVIAEAARKTKRARRQREREQRGIETSAALLPHQAGPLATARPASPPPASTPTISTSWAQFEEEVEIW